MSYDPSQALDDASALKRALAIRRILKPAYATIGEVSKWITRQHYLCDQQVESLKLRSGFLSLPDEILSVVLEFAAHRTSKDTHKAITRSASAATRLSHVCSRFRRLVISSPYLWDRVCPRMHIGSVTSCFARCGRNAEVHFSTSPYDRKVLRHFSSIITSNSSLWRRLIVDVTHGGQNLFTEQIEQLDEETILMRHLSVPFLTDLQVVYPDRALSTQYSRRSDQDRIHFYSTWSFARLSSMYAENLIPLPFSGSKSLQSLSIDLSLGWYGPDPGVLDVRALVSFFASCRALEKLALRISDCRNSIAFTPNSPVEMVNVANLDLQFVQCNSDAVGSLMTAIAFPNVSSLKLVICATVTIDIETAIDAARRECQSILHTVFGDSDTFPRLRELHFIISIDGLVGHHQIISFPFSYVPALKHLKITTYSTALALPSETVLLPDLRSLDLTKCFAIGPHWIAEFIRKLRSQRPVGTTPINISIDGRTIAS
ncbi:hypothetical protein SCHPADRAFT_332546 [Schizopora paradoxa]|uniref:Uncharacterized protein n=1 Tax=Schizopora paradoxa TaxID=27342 RepID=A0A0H2SB13_9AGAM|nr:hypothetical protein SCHPADRAFT_332546 [Schizopora paradoxa]